MRTVRRVLHREVFFSIVLVALAFAALFLFFDLLDELPDVGRQRGGSEYTLLKAVSYVLLYAPTRLYELLPIAVLIGAILALARLAQRSEFTILRISGLSPAMTLRGLLGLGMAFTAVTFVLGDYVAPAGVQAAQNIHGQLASGRVVGRSGAWLREKHADGSHYIVNVQSMPASDHMRNVLIVQTDARGRLLSKTQADSGIIHSNSNSSSTQEAVDTADSTGTAGADTAAKQPSVAWQLTGAVRTVLHGTDGRSMAEGESDKASDKASNKAAATAAKAAVQQPAIQRLQLPQYTWHTSLTGARVTAAMQRPDRMGAVRLWQYAQHLKSNGQDAQRYEIGFWRKIFYPLSCLVMMVLALPFGYLHFRSGSISNYVFIGILTGISFFLLNNVFGHIGNLNHWQPWLAAATPGLMYSAVALSVFVWLVRNR